jgi:sporulation protein YlmC with PRC-barrel domain
MRASETTGRPVVTLGGEDIAQVKDLVFWAGGGEVGGFTLAGRGLFAGPLHTALPWSNVLALGNDAVIVTDDEALTPVDTVLHGSHGAGGSGGDVLGSQVITDEGTELGTVVDAIIEVDRGRTARCDVMGYEIRPAPALGHQSATVLVPLPDTLSASGEYLVVPAGVRDFIRDDLAGFGTAVEDFRDRLGGQER